jgi:hypothetical protein
MRRVRDAVDGHFNLPRANLGRLLAKGSNDIGNGVDRAEDVRASGERHETGAGRDEREEILDLERKG